MRARKISEVQVDKESVDLTQGRTEFMHNHRVKVGDFMSRYIHYVRVDRTLATENEPKKQMPQSYLVWMFA